MDRQSNCSSGTRFLVALESIAVICLSIVALTCVTSINAQTSYPSPSPASSMQPYLPQRYDEDWSYLRDESKRTDALDVVKYIPLNDRGWYVSLGGEARIRYEYFTEFAFGAGPQDGNGYLLQRYLVHADFHLG